jgi:hypothetical protein
MNKPKSSIKKLKLKKPKLPSLAARSNKIRIKKAEDKVTEALGNVPRITNETVAEHREEVLSSARKYIYPLQHSKHRVVRTSIGLFIVVVIGFFVYCSLALYKFQSTDEFIYGVAQVIPFPVAKTGNSWISYQSYLFELRRNMHYYQSQQQVDFGTKDGKAQLQHLKQQALAQVVQDAYVKQLANKYHVSVSNLQVNNEVTLVRTQNRLGSSDRVFKDVLNQFWGWTEDDFKRELKGQLLQQAVVAKLDTATTARAQAALKQLQGGTDFGTLASQVSQDVATKTNGGQYGTAITQNDADIPPAVAQAIFNLKPNQISGIINTGYTLEIVKLISTSGNTAIAAHIQFNFQPITTYTKSLQVTEKPHDYIKI